MNHLPSSISKRLLALSEMVPLGSVVADIGSDHGLLVKELIKSGKVKKVYATDNKPGPFLILQKALFGVPFVHTYMGDGLEGLPNEVNVVIMAGMGGELINSITFPNVFQNPGVHTIIVSPNNKEKIVREEFFQFGFIILEEVLIEDKNQFYPIMKWTKGKANYNDLDLEFGPILRSIKSQSFMKMIQLRKDSLNLLLKGNLPSQRRQELNRQLERINKL